MRRLPPLHSLRAFEAAARHLHFAAAADELGLTPTAISHQVRQLEAMLGVSLFHRSPRPIHLTAAGARLYPELRDSLDRIAAAIVRISDEAEEAPLHLSVTVAFASRWLMPRLADLRRQTGLPITIEADDLPVDLRSSRIDVAIRYSVAPVADAESHRLFLDRMVPVAAPELVQTGALLSPVEVLALPLLHYRWKNNFANAPSWAHWQRFADASASKPNVDQFLSEEIHAIDAAVAGHGAALVSEVLVSDLLEAGKLVLLSNVVLPGPAYWMVFLPNHPARERFTVLLDWIRRQV